MDNLPPEMLLEIAKNLSSKDLVSLSGANQRIFATIANAKLLWQQQLRHTKFQACSELKKFMPKDSVNCQEKDEFLLQKQLHQNWKTGNFQIANITEPTAERNFSLGCAYNDFALWYATKGTNTWHLFLFDVDTGFHSAMFSYPVKMSEPLGFVPNWEIEQIQAASKTVIILQLVPSDGNSVTSEIVAIDISELNNLKVIWQLIHYLSDNDAEFWDQINVVNETVFIMKNGNPAFIDLYDAKSGNHTKTFHHTLLSNDLLSSFEFWIQTQKYRDVSDRCDFILIGGESIEDDQDETHLLSLDVNRLDLKHLKTFNNVDLIDFKHSGDRISYIIVDMNEHYSIKVLNLANGKVIQSIESQLPLMLHDFTNDESLYAFGETTENNISHYLHHWASDEKKCEVTTTARELREVHRECLIAIDNGFQGTGVSISINSFNNNGEVATETRKPLSHPYTADEDQAFKVQELVLLTSVAVTRFQNNVGANFWMELHFKPQ